MSTRSSHVVIIDGLNYLHRALGSRAPLTTVFTCLRKTVESLQATRAYFVLEGRPEAQLAVFADYKSNRKVQVDADDAEAVARGKVKEDFLVCMNFAVDLIARFLPISVVRHPRYEADSLIGTLVERMSSAVPITVVSSDTDFIQLLDRPHLKLFNAISKSYVMHEHTGDEYVAWKSLKGDPGDGIPGIRGIGKVTATRLVTHHDELWRVLADDPEKALIFKRNLELVRLVQLPETDFVEVESSSPTRAWEALREELRAAGQLRLTTDPYWTKKFITAFEPMWGIMEK